MSKSSLRYTSQSQRILVLGFIISFLSIAGYGYNQQWEQQRQQSTTANKPHIRGTDDRNWCRAPEEYNQGRWVRNNSTQLRYPYLSDPDPVWGPVCTQLQQQYLESGNKSAMLPDFLRYKWVPDSCELDNEWNQRTFCQRMDGMTIGVSGDSMSQQFVHSLMGLSRGSVENHEQFLVPKVWEGKPQHWAKLRIPLCPDDDDHSVILVYQRWDKYEGKDQDRAALTELIEESDYLILNWGVHYQAWSEMENSTDDFVGVLENHWTLPHKKPERLFWRSTNVAHANCSIATTGPLQDPDTTNKIGNVVHEQYNTQEILLQDEFIVKPRLLSRLPRTTLLRVEETTLKRPDGHRMEGFQGQEDCLHYCEPGPIDHWAELFYHHVVALAI